MNVLVLCDDRWHPAEIVSKGLEPLKSFNLKFEFLDNAAEWPEDEMEKYTVVILSKSNNISAEDARPWVTERIQDAFLRYVRQGGSLLAIHSGTAEYDEAITLRGLLGGVFKYHPEQCEVTVETVKGHPIIEASKSFTAVDEHYFMEMDDPKAYIFLNTTSKYGSQPGGWTRTEGKGRVCVITPGHNLEVWLNPVFQEIIKSSLEWCTDTVMDS